MISKKGKNSLIKIIAICGLVIISYSGFIISFSQSGPDWEVPQSVMVHIAMLPILITFGLIMLIFTIFNRRIIYERKKIGLHILTILSLSLILPILISVMEVEQWPIHFPRLSKFSKIYIFPLLLLLGVSELIYLVILISKEQKNNVCQ
jgi:cell division protein FtsW (lipid II flippase)